MLWTEKPLEMYERLIEERIPRDLECLKSEKDFIVCSAMGRLYDEYRLLGILEYVLHKDVGKFKANIETALEYKVARYKESLKKYPDAKIESYNEILDILSIKDFEAVKGLAQYIDDNYDYKQKPFHIADWLYRILICFILDKNTDKFDEYMEKLKKGYSSRQYQKLYPYALLLEAIWKKDTVQFHENLQVVVDVHKKMLRSIFEDYEDQFLCLWAIAFCNLARMKGMNICFDHPLIPQELIKG